MRTLKDIKRRIWFIMRIYSIVCQGWNYIKHYYQPWPSKEDVVLLLLLLALLFPQILTQGWLCLKPQTQSTPLNVCQLTINLMTFGWILNQDVIPLGISIRTYLLRSQTNSVSKVLPEKGTAWEYFYFGLGLGVTLNVDLEWQPWKTMNVKDEHWEHCKITVSRIGMECWAFWK